MIEPDVLAFDLTRTVPGSDRNTLMEGAIFLITERVLCYAWQVEGGLVTPAVINL